MINIEENTPKSTDSLFIEESNPNLGAWLKNPTDKFFLYSEGYKKAGQMLLNSCLMESFYNNTLIYPIMYNYRQFVELRLKELSILGYKYIEISNDFEDVHFIDRLWKTYRYEILIKINPDFDRRILDNVEKVIFEFSAEDLNSFNYRYPVSKKTNGTRTETLNRNTIDLKNFKEVIDRLVYFLDWQWDMLLHYQDIKEEMISEMNRNFY